MVARFFEFLDLTHPVNTVHNLRVCQLLLHAGGMSPASLEAVDAIAKARALAPDGWLLKSPVKPHCFA